ncbi:hypothetical protein FPQ18DRAFT_308490 [Pyronema domesticum]|nr:hypothetical protein FPQ18DRAFT_308490 [Pyronema domesticum]
MAELQQTPFDPTASATALTVPRRKHKANANMTWSDITPEIEEHLKLSMARFTNGLANAQIPVMTQRAVGLFNKAMQCFAIQANTASKSKKHEVSKGFEGISEARTISVTLTLGFQWLKYVDDSDDCDSGVGLGYLEDDCVPDLFNIEESETVARTRTRSRLQISASWIDSSPYSWLSSSFIRTLNTYSSWEVTSWGWSCRTRRTNDLGRGRFMARNS